MAASGPYSGIGTLYAFVLDVVDLEACGMFWSQVLGVDVLYQNEIYQRLGREGDQQFLLLQKVPEPHQDKNRAHLDVEVANLEEAANRIEQLGGHKFGAYSEHGVEWVVMADPDGNEFCLVKHT